MAPRTATLLILLALLGCEATQTDRPSKPVLLFAAASTSDVIDELQTRFQSEHDVTIRASYAATSTLVQQITNGAEADLFLSASVDWTDYLDQRGLIAERRDLLSNRLVIVVSADSDLSLDKPEDLSHTQIARIALADPTCVPAGVYAKQSLERLGLWDRLGPKLVPAADVRRALTFVETGAAEAGIVYATDAADSTAVRVAVRLDAELSDPIRYPIALLPRAKTNPAAKRFFDYLTSPDAAKLFRKHHFVVLDE